MESRAVSHEEYVDVLLPLAAPGVFTYILPARFAGVGVGSRVSVAFGRGASKQYTGIVVRRHAAKPDAALRLREVDDAPREAPLVTPRQLDLWRWISRYYLCQPGEVMKAALPAGLKPESETMLCLRDKEEALRQAQAGQLAPAEQAIVVALTTARAQRIEQLAKNLGLRSILPAVRRLIEAGLVQTAEKMKRGAGTRVALDAGTEADAPQVKALGAEQQRGLTEVLSAFKEKNVCLLHGVTASGKTEIYIHLIQRELAAGRQVLYLLPEIALTTQITARLHRALGAALGVYHSRLTDAQRSALWRKQLSAEAYPVILGVRSAVLLPFQRLGLVIIDEEHEGSFKQHDPAPRYNARDVATVLAAQCGAKTLLGTATPALETYYNAAVRGKYGLVTLTKRYGGAQLPEVVVEDVSELRRKKEMVSLFSPRLREAMQAALGRGEQVILFQNRRGFSPVITCRACGWTPRCTACDVSLTYHREANQLVCHYCGAHYPLPRACPACEGTALRDIGYGTERVEDEVHQLFPAARLARLDLDSTRSRAAYEKIIDDFAAQRTNILIGTQMVTKGLDFGGVSVVGILSADQMISQPDFRAYERAFQMMAQVAGRAGRRGRRGLVVLQTRQPDLPVVQQVVANNYAAMFSEQLSERRAFRYPPFYRVVAIGFKHSNEAVCQRAADTFAAWLRPHFGGDLLGPDRPAVARVQRLHLRQLVLKVSTEYPAEGVRATLRAAADALWRIEAFRSVRLVFDVDPL